MKTYKRKTERGTKSLEIMKKAAKLVIEEGQPIRGVAKQFELCHMTLSRFVKKQQKGLQVSVGYKPVRQVFNGEQERLLTAYLLKCSSIFFGLLPIEVRKLAYECATQFEIGSLPNSWHERGMAGPDWLTAFIKRNQSLSIRSPEATSLSRATSFNRSNVRNFFSKLGEIMLKHELPPSRIWNLDETSVLTVQRPKKVLAQKGIKQVGAITSAERGTLVTVEMAINAVGNSIPPMFVFPRLKYKALFIRDGPPESIGAGNSSGWMTVTEFLVYMDHFIKFVKPTISKPILLLLDNHSSHIDIKVIEKAKSNGIIMLSFPPHCTHRLQPLDVGVYGPFKHYCSVAQGNWMRSNAGKSMSIYELPGIVKYAWPLASTPRNIQNGFQKTGIYPFNQNIFNDEDFAPSLITDRQPILSDTVPITKNNEVLKEKELVSETSEVDKAVAGLSNSRHAVNTSITIDSLPDPPSGLIEKTTFSPESVRPFPKAPPRGSVKFVSPLF